MHIEPGILSATKVAAADVAALAVMGAALPALLRRPALILRTLLASVFFTLFMQAFHLRIGPSELHFVGAMPIYLSLGFVPTLLGFGIGLLVQGLVFEPADLINLGVNTLSLALPLIVVHGLFGKRLARLDLSTILKLDAAYYGGVTLMVGFWLAFAEVATPVAAWAAFAASYLTIVACEPLLTYVSVGLIRRHADKPGVRLCFAPAGRA